jgi:hypothetical protein
MRMLLKYSLLAMTAAGLLLAQHGGGGGGHHGGGGSFGGGFASHPSTSGYSGFNSGRAAAPSAGYQPRSYGYIVPNRGTYSYSTGINRTLGRRYGYGSGRRYGYYGLAYYPVFGYGDSWYDPSYYAPYDQYAPYEDPQYGQYGMMQDPSVEMMGNNSYPQAPYPQSPYYMAPPMGPQLAQQPAPNDALPPAAPIVVVLKNGQRVQMQSYGIMNGLLWDFGRPNSQRIPMVNIDVAASVKATEEAGGSFPEQFFATNPN